MIKSNKIIRIMAMILGLFFVLFPLFLFFYSGSTDMWVQPIVGIIFLIYAIGGNELLSKIKGFSFYSNKVGRK